MLIHLRRLVPARTRPAVAPHQMLVHGAALAAAQCAPFPSIGLHPSRIGHRSLDLLRGTQAISGVTPPSASASLAAPIAIVRHPRSNPQSEGTRTRCVRTAGKGLPCQRAHGHEMIHAAPRDPQLVPGRGGDADSDVGANTDGSGGLTWQRSSSRRCLPPCLAYPEGWGSWDGEEGRKKGWWTWNRAACAGMEDLQARRSLEGLLDARPRASHLPSALARLGPAPLPPRRRQIELARRPMPSPPARTSLSSPEVVGGGAGRCRRRVTLARSSRLARTSSYKWCDARGDRDEDEDVCHGVQDHIDIGAERCRGFGWGREDGRRRAREYSVLAIDTHSLLSWMLRERGGQGGPRSAPAPPLTCTATEA
ncbi:hypothetical protein B0H13DRAFT_2677939 [Mycena leptocephala]|nr:hypothetical protein B0H13DRAFT_2677939 [Mycena leptocephala]